MRDLLSSDHTAAVSASEYSELASERRDTERAVTLWHQKAAELGWPPPLEAFDLSRMTSDWAYRFVICGEDVEHSVFLLYGNAARPVARVTGESKLLRSHDRTTAGAVSPPVRGGLWGGHHCFGTCTVQRCD